MLAAVAVAVLGMAAGERITDLQWLAALAVAGALLLVAIWPRMPRDTPVTARTTAELGALFAALFVVAITQLLRTQVVLAGPISRRSGVISLNGGASG